MLSQLSRLIGLEGRPQANWICRSLINSGKVLFFFPPRARQADCRALFSPPLLPLNPPLFRTPTAAFRGDTGEARLRVRACETDSVGHLQILIKYHLTCPTSKSHHTWSDQAGGGIRVAGVKRALGVACQFSTRHLFSFPKKECWFSHQSHFEFQIKHLDIHT